MAVMKVIEVMANSDKSWEDATRQAVKQIKSVFVQSQSAVVKGDDVKEFRVNVKITFEVQ